jgi:hypothetical protein
VAEAIAGAAGCQPARAAERRADDQVPAGGLLHRRQRGYRSGPGSERGHLGITAALHGQITLKNGRVKQTNFHNYQMLRMNEASAVEVHVIISCARFHTAAAQIPLGVPDCRRESPQGSEADQHEGSSTDVHFGDVRKVGDPMGLALSPGASLHARTRA